MATLSDPQDAPKTSEQPNLLAFYLPQFHPVAENDTWWGPGFTEWTNVVRARPLFPGHYQPHLPGELGFYDLRLAEVRDEQARLAAAYGISGFCYYHYWFHGRRVLGRPFDEVLSSGQPRFPFALCWANEDWTRNWDARTGETLIRQDYSEQDDRAHIAWLAKAFADERYITIDGRPLMLVYRTSKLPNPRRTAAIWREQVQKLGFPDLYLCRVDSHAEQTDPALDGFDASVGFIPVHFGRTVTSLPGHLNNQIIDYREAAEEELSTPTPAYKHFPAVMVGWDNSPRRRNEAKIYVNATPEAYEWWLSATLSQVRHVRAEENFVFLVAWNEWGEGNHLEPDQRYGRAFLESTRRALDAFSALPDAEGPASANGVPDPPKAADSYRYEHPFTADSAFGHIVSMIEALVPKGRRVVDFGAGGGMLGLVLQERGYRYSGFDIDEDALVVLAERDLEHARCDVSDPDQMRKAIEECEDIGAIILVDVLEHLVDPQIVLHELAEWAAENPSVVLLVSVPNVAHFDIGVRLLLGDWEPRPWGLLDSTHLRFFTNETLERLVTRSGWQVIARDDFHNLRSEHFPERTLDSLPLPVFGAVDLLARRENRFSTVYQFVWALRADKPAGTMTFMDAVASDDRHQADPVAVSSETATALETYIADLSLLTAEASRRARSGWQEDSPRRVQILGPLLEGNGFENRLVAEGLGVLADVYSSRPDLQGTFERDGTVNVLGLLEWAQMAEGYGDAEGPRLQRFAEGFSEVETFVRAGPTELVILATVGLNRLDVSPRQHRALLELAGLYDERPDLQQAFDVRTPVGVADLLSWALRAQEWGDHHGPGLEAYRDRYESIARLLSP